MKVPDNHRFVFSKIQFSNLSKTNGANNCWSKTKKKDLKFKKMKEDIHDIVLSSIINFDRDAIS